MIQIKISNSFIHCFKSYCVFYLAGIWESECVSLAKLHKNTISCKTFDILKWQCVCHAMSEGKGFFLFILIFLPCNSIPFLSIHIGESTFTGELNCLWPQEPTQKHVKTDVMCLLLELTSFVFNLITVQLSPVPPNGLIVHIYTNTQETTASLYAANMLFVLCILFAC